MFKLDMSEIGDSFQMSPEQKETINPKFIIDIETEFGNFFQYAETKYDHEVYPTFYQMANKNWVRCGFNTTKKEIETKPFDFLCNVIKNPSIHIFDKYSVIEFDTIREIRQYQHITVSMVRAGKIDNSYMIIGCDFFKNNSNELKEYLDRIKAKRSRILNEQKYTIINSNNFREIRKYDNFYAQFVKQNLFSGTVYFVSDISKNLKYFNLSLFN